MQQIVSYAYGDADWKDKLTRYNGVDIAYDAIGNPIQDGVWTYTWENGRQLRRMACDATIAEFVYNADGLRVQKTVNGVATNYTLHGKNIVHMTKGNAELHFWYDAQNRPAIVEFNGTKYGYLYNLQGDVIGLIDSANTEVVRYTYDAWGKPLSVTGSLANTIGYYNPFRYRGYVYDVETGLYYLRSRYYNPNWGRFVNADALLTHNVFAYCNNMPISMQDPDGYLAFGSFSSVFVKYEDVLSKSQFHESVTADMQYFIESPEKFNYQKGGYREPQNGKPGAVCCAYLMYENWGGLKGSNLRYYDCKKKGKIKDIIDLINAGTPIETFVGYEVYQWLGNYKDGQKHMQHVGRIVLHDFGDGLELAVYQSSSTDSISYCKALFPKDVGGGPNITALFDYNGGTGDWTHYGIPK